MSDRTILKITDDETRFIVAPFTDEQVAALNRFQEGGLWHPFTCAICRDVLVAETAGWVCPNGDDYYQNWAHIFMADDNWLRDRRSQMAELRENTL